MAKWIVEQPGTQDSAPQQAQQPLSVPSQQPMQTGNQDNESPLPGPLRNLLRAGTVGTSTLVGFPGDVAAGLGSLLNILGKKTTGEDIVPDLRNLDYFPTSERILRTIQEDPTQKIAQSFNLQPTPKEVQQSAQLQQKTFKPQTPGEENLDQFVQDFTTFLFPLPGAPVTQARAIGSAATAGAGQLGKWLAQKLDYSPATQDTARLGTMLATQLGGGALLNKHSNTLNKTIKDVMPPDTATLATQPLKNTIEDITRTYIDAPFSARVSPEKIKIADIINDLEPFTKSATGKATALNPSNAYTITQELLDVRKGLKNPRAIQQVDKLLGSFEKPVSSLKNTYPEFVDAFNQQLNLTKEMNIASRANKWIQTTADKVIDKLSNPLSFYIAGIPGAIKGITGATLARNVSRSLERFINNPTARQEYARFLSNVGARDAAATQNSLVRMDKMLRTLSPATKSDQQRTEPKKTAPPSKWIIEQS